MYSPKIKKDLIPILYRLAKKQGKPMTRLVDELLKESLRGVYHESIINTHQGEPSYNKGRP
jgi:hypothetical protein